MFHDTSCTRKGLTIKGYDNVHSPIDNRTQPDNNADIKTAD